MLWSDYATHIVDPCAGEGRALATISGAIPRSTAWAIEAEKTRAISIRKSFPNIRVQRGDFFNLNFTGSASLLWLNPPYDHDPETGRLEERFLRDALRLLVNKGVLAFVVPYYALAASIETLTRNFHDLRCYRFPDEEWDAYKQVVLFGSRKPNVPAFAAPAADKEMISMWSRDPDSIPAMPYEPVIEIPYSGGFYTWETLPFRVQGIEDEFDVWVSERGPVKDIYPPDDIQAESNKTYPVASRPRATHLAAALSAGVFNGVKIEPDDPDSGLPDLLVKGVFDKEFRRIEDKTNKKGEKVAEVQVQHPKLSVTVLDLSSGEFHEVASSVEDSGSIENLTMKGLLDNYGRSLMSGMLEACPVLHDPDNDPDPIPMPELARPLYPAQAEAVRTILKLRERNPDDGVVVLGEIGSGKTSVALTSLKAMGSKKPLVVCPPHLLDSWREQVEAVVPDDYPVFVLENVTTARDFATAQRGIGLLSREKAKLSHSREGISGRCPKCNTVVDPDIDHGKKRSRCDHETYIPSNDFAKWLVKHSGSILPFIPRSRTANLIQSRILRRHYRGMEAKDFRWDNRLDQAVLDLIALIRRHEKQGANLFEIRLWLGWLLPNLAIAFASGQNMTWSDDMKSKALLMAADKEAFDQHIDTKTKERSHFYVSTQWEALRKEYQGVHEEGGTFQNVKRDNGVLTMDGVPVHSERALARVMDAVYEHCKFRKRVCGEFLYQSRPPHRVAIATWIRRYHPHCYDALVLDEAHEFSNRNSAQTQAAQTLMQSKAPKVLLTGSLVNGYAESVYMNMYGTNSRFREVFGRDNITQFIDRYGYWKQIVQDKDIEGKVVEFGSQSNRVMRTTRKAGTAPGVLPVFLLEYVLPNAVTLQKEDLGLGIPPRFDEKAEVEAEGEVLGHYIGMLAAVTDEIKRTRNIEGLSGKLWGALARLPSYLDLAAVGNTDSGDFEIRWPEDVPDIGGHLIYSAPQHDPGITLPKEKWILERIRSEVNEGRNVILMAWHTRLIPRLAEMVKAEGFRTEILDPAKVPTAKRQDWIDKKIVKKSVQVMICNPVVIQTGLNNLVHFSTEIWAENPMCNAIVYRQACGRIDRIGQTQPSRVLFPVYENTAQSAQYTLLMHKIGVSKSVDGLDPEEALRAAGVVDSEYIGFSVGKQLYRMITGET